MCAGKTAPYISKTVGTAISSDCDYSYYPKADLPLPSLTFCATAAKNARSSAAIITGAPGTGSGSIPFATALAQEEVQQSQSQSSTTTQSDAANYTQPAPTQATEEPACETSDDYWQLTVKNYQEAETDQFLYHWWHGGDWVKYDSEYYPPEPNRNDDGVHQGVAQQLPAQAAGYQTFNCLGSSVNNDCHSPTDDFRQYCKQGMQRWVYFAWISMFHMWSVMNDMKVRRRTTTRRQENTEFLDRNKQSKASRQPSRPLKTSYPHFNEMEESLIQNYMTHRPPCRSWVRSSR